MTEQKFKSEIRRAQAMVRLDADRSEYWIGYQQGLRRIFHGAKFSTKAEHLQWLALLEDSNEGRRQRGQGYRDALAFDRALPRVGRPRIGDEPTINVGLRLQVSIAKKIPKPRGLWIRTLIEKNLPE